MAWFTRKDKGIKTPTEAKREAPDGLWYKTPGGTTIHIRELRNNAYVCPDDGYHVRIGSKSILRSFLTIISLRSSTKTYSLPIP